MSNQECAREDVMALQLWKEEGPVAGFASWKENGKYYWARLPANCNLREPDLDGVAAHEIPCVEDFFGEWKEGMLEAPRDLHGASGIYIKKPQIGRYAGDAVAAELAKEDPTQKAPDLARSKSDVAAALQHDAEMYEILRDHPHENIAVYHGCVREGDHHFSGICLKRYNTPLFQVMQDHAEKTQMLSEDRIDEIIKGVEAGLKHIHSLGYVHNDVTPTNIMVDERGRPVLIDFDGCRKLGTEVIAGDHPETPGYCLDPRPEKYEAKNDFRMLKTIEKEMTEGLPPFSNA